jgi:sec-independent protein translocase protein TatA
LSPLGDLVTVKCRLGCITVFVHATELPRRREESAMFGLGTGEILLILVVLVVLFGAKKIPELGDALGKGIRSFRKATDTGVIEVEREKDKGTLESHERAPEPGTRATAASEKKS